MHVKLADLAGLTGKRVKSGHPVYWKSQELPAAVTALRSLLPATPSTELCVLDGAMPHSLALALIHAITTMHAAVFDPNNGNEVVRIELVEPVDQGSFLEFKVKEVEEFTLIDFSIPGAFMHVSRLPEVAPPLINTAKGVIISGHGPHWLTGTLGMAYKSLPWVAMRQINKGATIAFSNVGDERFKAGTVIPEPVLQEAWLRIITPRRGEVWFFDDGNGPHPGVILSTDTRNARSADVVLIPLTSKVEKFRPFRQNIKIPAGTGGLNKDCLAKCHQVTTVSKARLQGKPLGVFPESLLQQLLLQVRCALGDIVAVPCISADQRIAGDDCCAMP